MNWARRERALGLAVDINVRTRTGPRRCNAGIVEEQVNAAELSKCEIGEAPNGLEAGNVAVLRAHGDVAWHKVFRGRKPVNIDVGENEFHSTLGTSNSQFATDAARRPPYQSVNQIGHPSAHCVPIVIGLTEAFGLPRSSQIGKAPKRS